MNVADAPASIFEEDNGEGGKGPERTRRSTPVAMAERLCNMSCGELVELAAALADRPDGEVVRVALMTALEKEEKLETRRGFEEWLERGQ